ncbi:MAG: ABC transporter substrate-binding protein [Pseudomonas sp.]|jgi:NitT/TauT family transport system substrate-binding protein|nr:ABC transporter substrate-binding protein [Pseudomonas sp.]MDD2223881.1 ABC transporter substrate-binding protein [Pseudomonas sp.]MDY0413644.1 ABC transporter substrate-binding protein [Pseudomonas sp.]NLO54765.1 ABC transporter substrate-binding protein [Gammaproteobacteria bacterium]
MRTLLLIVLCVSFLAGCESPSEPLRIGSNRWLGYAPMYLADELGWATLSNIRLVEYPTANGVIRGLHNGLLDAALLTLDEAIMLQSTGHDVEVVLVTNLSTGADVLYAQPHIRSLADLKGQRIAAEGGTLAAYFLAHILDKAQLSIHDIKVVNIPVYMHLDALSTGKVDASINTSAAHNPILATGALPLLSSRELNNEIIDVLVVNRQRTSPTLRARIRALWYSSLDAWLEHRDKGDTLIQKRLGIDATTLIQTLNGIVMGDKALNAVYLEQGVLATRIQSMQSYMLEKGQLKHPVDASLLLPACTGDSC